MYLPKEWADDEAKRKKAGVPEDITFKTKPEIVLELVKQALEDSIPRGIVLADAGYGADTNYRDALTALRLSYAMGIGPGASVLATGTGPLPSKDWSGKGRPPVRLRRAEEHQPVSVKALALTLAKSEWQTGRRRQRLEIPLCQVAGTPRS
jgi:SRSO17 transposase